MKNFELFKKEQFRKCQATQAKRQDEDGNIIVIFYSYACPEAVKINWTWYKFTYENSRKAWSITSSITTSKQLTMYFWKGRNNLPKMNLQDFENEYFYTEIDWLY